MANNNEYIIIDEPKVRFLEKLIVNPIIVLFAAMIIPMFVNLPFYGRWWLPFVWLIFNGIILGSPTIKKEIIYSIVGFVLLAALLFGTTYMLNTGMTFSFSIVSYLVIIMNAVFFLFLYLLVFTQGAPYQIYQYIKGE
ncbi:MAG: hypothetical protein JKX98_00945 [Alcanivoracaceae bacterium]|nr:hypothetical protein [Alcanivoracaceae bacterium]